MWSKKRFRFLLYIFVMTIVVLGCQLPFLGWFSRFTKSEPDPLVAAIEEMRGASGVPLEISFEDGYPASVIGAFPAAAGDTVTQALTFLSAYSDLYYMDDPDMEIKLRRMEENGALTHVVFYQTYKSLPVYTAQLVVSLDGNTVIGSSGSLLHGISLDVAPQKTGLQAETAAREALQMPQEIKMIGEPALTIFDLNLLDNSQPRDARLAWHISFGDNSGTVAFIDAHNGNLLHHFGTTHYFDYDFSDAHGHSARHDCYAFTPQDKDIGDETGIFDSDYLNDQEALDNWQYGYDAYWYYALRFNRSGFNGNDYELEIHINTNILDKGWRGSYYEICHSIDIADGINSYYVVAHEYTHGVTDFTSDLKYNNQPGALSEFFAYIMGSLAEYQVAGYSGEFQRLGSNSRDHMYKYLDGSEDNGQVHENAWIPGRAAYLITAGGEHNGYNIIGLGTYKAEDLFYSTMISLPSHASFEVMANNAVAHAISWAGNGSWTDQDVCQVRNAFVSVGILEYGDADCDGIPDIYENDSDGDFILDVNDNCPQAANPTQSDNDGDGLGDACDTDDDDDGIKDFQDNCQWVANPDQLNADESDGSRFGDACEDSDYDNVIDSLDNCPNLPNSHQLDLDVDGIGDDCDPDDDNDGTPDADDNCPRIAQVPGYEDEDNDGDGVGDFCDNCVWEVNPGQPDTDGNGYGDACDPDDDNDDVLDENDNCPLVPNTNQIDLDFDGIGFACDEDEQPLLLQAEFGGTFQASPGDYFRLKVPFCAGYGQTPNLRAQAVVSGLPDEIGTWMTNQYGEMVAKPRGKVGSRTIEFPQLGGEEYLLVFSASPDLDGPLDVDFNVKTNCGHTQGADAPPQVEDRLEDEPAEEPAEEPSDKPQPQPTVTVQPPAEKPPTAVPTSTNTPEPPPDGWITGQVWKDMNANSINDKGDQSYSGVTVTLGAGSCASSGEGSSVTDGSGNFRFDNLAPGTYCVTVDIAETCGTVSIPTTPLQRTVTVSPGAGVDAGLFGFTPYIC